MIPPKFVVMPSFEASFNDNKVASNLESKCSNLVVQLVCPSGLSTFFPPITPDLSEIQVLPNEKDKPLPKIFFKIMIFLANAKTYELHSFRG